jgi:hypothetical protein
MAIDGTWGFVYWGEAGVGIGAFVVEKDGKLRGSDGNIKYSGTAVENASSQKVHLSVDMEIPAGIALVGGAGASEFVHKRHVELDLPPRFGELAPQDASALPGRTGIVFKQVPSEWASFANGFTVTPKAQ